MPPPNELDSWAVERAVMAPEESPNGFQEAVLMLRATAEMLLRCSANRGGAFADYGYLECPCCQRNLHASLEKVMGVEGTVGQHADHKTPHWAARHEFGHAPDCELFRMLQALAGHGFIRLQPE